MHKSWLRSVMVYDRNLLVAPRCHGKSSLMAIAVPCYMIGRNPNIRIKIISCADDRAKDITFAVFRILKGNERYREVFPEVKLDNKRMSKQKIYIVRDQKHDAMKDATAESLGVTSAAEGSRADLLIMDDVVSKRNSKTPGLRQLVKEMYYNVHINLLDPMNHSKVIYIGTVWDIDDLTVELMDKKNEYHKEVYSIDDDFNPLWPEIWPKEKLLERCKEIGIRRFNIGFRNQPASDQSFAFSDEMFDTNVDPSLPLDRLIEIALENIKAGKWKVAFGVDTAAADPAKATASQKYRRCFNVIYVLAIDENKRRIPIHIRRFQARSPETARLVLDAYNLFKPEVILIESNAQTALAEWLGEMSKLPIRTYFTHTDNKNDSEIGVNSLRTEFENRMWRLPSYHHEEDCKCDFCIWQQEMLSYPFGRFSDTVMACWLAREGIRLHITGVESAGGFSIWEH